ncbi:MAG: glycoside hydrolase family 92 protein, partial [Pseudomonadota bacterium]|nr:glycoside hydrolase family 92 protein [Pseudomonadota bacterium]
DNGPETPYIQSVTFNGKPWTRSWISHADLVGGGELVFHMGATPNHKFGAAPEDRPPSFGAPMSA